MRPVFTFVVGALLFLGSITLRLLDGFQRLEYLKSTHPHFYAWLVSPIVEYAAIGVGVVVMAVGIIEIRRSGKKLSSPNPKIQHLGIQPTESKPMEYKSPMLQKLPTHVEQHSEGPNSPNIVGDDNRVN